MTVRTAACRCGQVRASCEGEPVRISVCHCLDCQRRSGSAFSAQARFSKDKVTVTGETKLFACRGDSGKLAKFQFCPDCGSTIAYEIEVFPDLLAIPIGAFADPHFPPPTISVWEERMHGWTSVLGDGVEHLE